MKKLLAILCTVVLLFGSISCGIVLQSTAAEASYTNRFYYDFSQPKDYSRPSAQSTWKSPDRHSVNGDVFKPFTTSSVVYDETVKALKITGNGTGPVDLDVRGFDRRQQVWVRENTVLAFKVKLADTNAKLDSVYMALHDGNAAATCTNEYKLKTVPEYKKTTDWQLVIVDLTSANWPQELVTLESACDPGTPNTWWAARVHLTQAGYTAPVYVEWIGTFANADTATKHYNGEKPEGGGNQGGNEGGGNQGGNEGGNEGGGNQGGNEGGNQGGTETPATNKTAWYFDFSTQEKFTDMTDYGVHDNNESPRTLVNTNNSYSTRFSTFDYDDTNKAMKLTATNGAAIQLDLQCLDWRAGLDYKKHTALALKVKLSDTSAEYSFSTIRANDGQATAVAGNLQDLSSKPVYKKTTDWQLIVVDLSTASWKQSLKDIDAANTAAGTSSNWWGTRLVLSQAGYTGAIYVQWAGIFESEEKAKAHYNQDMGILPESNTTAFLFDFTTQDKYTDMTNFRYPATDGSNPRTMVNQRTNPLDIAKYGAVSFDAEQGALKLVGTGTDAPTLDLRCLDWRGKLDISKHTVLALKMKLDGAKASTMQMAQMYANDGAVTADNVRAGDILRELPNAPSYASSDGWQLVIVDLSSDNYDETLKTIAKQNVANNTVSNWWGTCLTLAEAGYTDPIYIAWAGIFENEGKALAHYADTTKNVKTNYMFDFSSQAKFTDMTDFNVNGNTSRPRTIVNMNNANLTNNNYSIVAFDDGNQAMKLTAQNGSAIQLDLQCLDWRVGLDYLNTNTLALKVKLSNPNAQFGMSTIRANDGAALETAGSLHELVKSPVYQETTDWQLVVVDLSKSNWKETLKIIATQNEAANTSSNWWGTRLVLSQAGYTGEIYVEWVGIFQNESNAVAHYLNTTPDVDLANVGLVGNNIKKPTHSKFFYDFSSQAAYNENIENNRVVLNIPNSATTVYDTQQEALKLVSGDSAAAPFLELMSHDRVLNINTGHTLAVKVKIPSAQTKFQGAYMYAKDDASVDSLIGGNNSIEDSQKFKELREYPNYTNSTAWQLLLIDLSDANRFENLANKTGVWYGTRLLLNAAGSTDPFYVAWVGIFNNDEEAKAYFDYTTQDNPGGTFEEEFNPDAVEAPTPIFWDFSTKSSINAVEGKGDTALEYDSALRAMKVEVKDTNEDGAATASPGNIVLGSKVALEKGHTMEDYPIFVLRVKLSQRDLEGGMFSAVSTGSRENMDILGSAQVDLDNLDYAKTTNWQTMVIDYRENDTASFFMGGEWVSFSIKLLNENIALAGDTLWVKWAGAFANMSDVDAYLAATAQVETGNDDDQYVPDEGEDEDEDDDKNDQDNSNDSEDAGESPDTGDTALTVTVAMILLAAATVALFMVKKRRQPNT